jgi:hypothetical protein
MMKMTPMELEAGRFMRAPDHPTGDVDGQVDNNAAVIPPARETPDSGADNASKTIDAEAFWKDETPAPDAGDGSAEARELGTQLTTSLQNLSFGEGIVNDVVGQEMSEGKFDTFNQRMTEHGRQVTRQTLGMSMTIMKAVEAQIMRKADERIQAALAGRDSEADLFAGIPSAKNPAVRPQIQRIYDRALVVAKGDKKEAMEMTRTLARMTAETMAPDLGLRLSPGDPSSSAPPETDWMTELMGK